MKHLIVLNVNHHGWFPVLWNKIEKIQNFFASAFNVFFFPFQMLLKIILLP